MGRIQKRKIVLLNFFPCCSGNNLFKFIFVTKIPLLYWYCRRLRGDVLSWLPKDSKSFLPRFEMAKNYFYGGWRIYIMLVLRKCSSLKFTLHNKPFGELRSGSPKIV
jgi:hypothetical protein